MGNRFLGDIAPIGKECEDRCKSFFKWLRSAPNWQPLPYNARWEVSTIEVTIKDLFVQPQLGGINRSKLFLLFASLF